MQVSPDYVISGTPDVLERLLIGFKFSGPGFYLTDTDTVLVVPLVKDPQWKKNWPEGTKFQANVYNCPLYETIFDSCRTSPVRLDTRQDF